MTKSQKEYKKLVSYILRDVTKSLKPMIRKLVQEEVIYANRLLSETQRQQPITITDSEVSRTNVPIGTNKGKDIGTIYSNLLEQTNRLPEQSNIQMLNVMGKDIPIDMTPSPTEQIQTELGDITLTGNDSSVMTEEGAKMAIKVQTKDYSQIMKKMLNSNKKIGLA